MRGTLGEGVLPALLRDLYVGRKTGYLYFSRPGHNCNVLFRRGHIVHASTDKAEDWLGEVLVGNGMLSREHFEQAAAQAERERKRLGRVLCDQGLLQAERLEEGMALQVRQILFRVFSWPDGAYHFEALAEIASQEVTLKVSTGDMILEAVRRVRDPEAVRRALGDMDLPLGLSPDPLLRFQNITLAPADVHVLACVDGTLSARQVVQALPFDGDEASRSLFGLLCTGVIDRLPPRRAAARAVAGAPASMPLAEPGPAPAPASESAKDMDARRHEILDLFEGLRTRTHYDLLGVPRGASDGDVKEAYFRMARRFHPDAHHHAGLADLGPKLEAVFIRLGEAYEVLRHNHSRASYDRTLPSPAAAAPPPPPVAAPDPVQDQKVAAENVRRGEKHLAEARYWDAIQLFESALEHVDGPLKQRALLGLARALLRNPNWVKRAEETLQELLRVAPRHVDGLTELALLYESTGLKSRALTAFRRVLEVQPDNEQALVKTAELSPPAPPEPGGGRLKKLFGRR